MSWWDTVIQITQVLSSLAIGVAIWVAVGQLRSQNKQQHREFENLYVQRYWSIVDRFGSDYRLNGRRTDLDETDLMACQAYLQLCEDEVDLYEAGRITSDTWEIWKSGIDSMLEEDHFRQILESTPEESYKTLRRYIREKKLAPRYRGTKAALRGL